MIDPAAPDYDNTPVSPERPPCRYRPAETAAAPAVSVITPYFNTGPIFLETVQSMRQQSLQQWEWIIVNDGSTDIHTQALFDEVRRHDSRIAILNQPHRGRSAARNAGAKAARAPVLYFLDTDDLIEPTALEKLMWMLVSDARASFVTGWNVGFGQETYLWPRGFEARDAFLSENNATMAALIHKSVFEQAGGFDEDINLLEDYDLWLRCASLGFWGRDLPEYVHWYRRRLDHPWTPLLSEPKQRIQFMDEMRRRYPDLFAQGVPRLPRDNWTDIAFQPIPTQRPFENLLLHPQAGMCILMIVPWMKMGGADKFNLDAIKQLQRLGHQVTVCATLESDNSWLPEFTRTTPDVFVLSNFLRPPDFPRFLDYLINSRQIDVLLVSNSFLGYQLLPFLRSKWPSVAIADMCHMEEENWRSGGYPRNGVAYQEVIDLNIVSSDHLKVWMVDNGAEHDRIATLHTGIDVEKWSRPEILHPSILADLRVTDSTPIVMYAGRLCRQKRPELFAEIVCQLVGLNLSFVCLVLGDGPDRERLEMKLREFRLERRVKLLGAVSNDRLKEMMAATDIFLLPSEMEGISLALYEAMAMGVVPVAADVGGQRELVTPECGFLVRPGPNELAEYVAALRLLIQQPDTRAAMARAGRERVATFFRIEQMGERLERLLLRAITNSRTVPRPAVGPGLGLESAVQAIEYTRLERLADAMWAQLHHGLHIPAHEAPWTRRPWLRRGAGLANIVLKRFPRLRRSLKAALQAGLQDVQQ